jgi:hypothetical protein
MTGDFTPTQASGPDREIEAAAFLEPRTRQGRLEFGTAWLRGPSATEQADQQRNHQEGKEEEEQHLRDAGSGTRNATKTEYTCDDRNYEKE